MIPDAVGAALNDTDLGVESLHETERDFVVGMAVTGDAIPMAFDHGGEILKGLESAPAQLGFPVVEKFSSPCGVLVVPQLPERFFEQIGLLDTPVGLEEEPERSSAFQIEIGMVRQERVALAFDESPILLAHPPIFDSPDVVHRVGEMPKDVKFVVDDPGVGRVSLRGGSEGFPHIHHGQLDSLARPLADFPVEFVQFLLAASLASHPDRSLSIQIGDQDRIALSLSDRYFVHADGSDSLRWRMLAQQLPHILHLDSSDLIPLEMIHLGDANQTRLSALPADEPFESAGVPLR